MYRVAHQVGRLVEIAIGSPVSLDEVEQWGREHDAVVDGVGEAYICFVDLRRASVFPPDVVEAYVSVMRSEQQLIRTATMLPDSPVVALQIGRMIREAGHPQRRAFDDPSELTRWLSEVMGPLERARLRSLLE
ncbi:MAG: hypothetical protein AAF799_17820 [Myxococcota bacterium]